MVLLLIFIHWSPGVFERLSWDYLAITNPIFRIATPGFAMIFGLSMGLYIFQRFNSDPKKAIIRLRKSFFVLAIAILILAAIKFSIIYLEGSINLNLLPASIFFSVLLYYLLAIASIPLWYYILNKFKNVMIASLFASLIMYVLADVAKILLPSSAGLNGFVRLAGLMIEAKYNYFDMSAVVFMGIALGVYINNLLKTEQKGHDLLSVGLLLIFLGVLVSYETGQIDLWLTIELTPIWMDISYFGTVIIMLSLALKYSYVIDKSEIPNILFRIVAVLGTYSLWIYIGHGLVIPLKDLFVAMGLNYPVSITGSILLFTVAVAIPTARRYKKFYMK